MKKIILSAFVIAASGAYVWSQAGGAPDPLLASADIQTGSIQPQAVASNDGTMNVAPREVPFVTRGTTASAAPAPSVPASAPAPATNGALPSLPAPGDSSGFAPASADNNNTPAPAPSAPAPFVVADAQTPAAPSAPAPADNGAVNIPMPRLRPPYHQVAAAAPTLAPASAHSSTPDPSAASALQRIAAATSGLSDGTYRGPIENAYYGLMQIEAVVRNGRLATIHVIRYPNTHSTSIYINRRALPELRDEVINAQSAHVDIVSGATLSSHAFIRSLGAALRKARA